ncbi:serine-rich coiled-coil domain-containing protein 2-like [Lampris incognitus]|uniref:serine-rich coiled-coil domain-containing protein 2-like n=1 Tax=Lampris incognitus TaxID=2546036 RepID=UPI0024B53937|nr:serine-rich coiled-coil domain-containing protein 2-like [Lampris incognitus]
MSAPPLIDLPAMPTMVSRLPKFGSRATSGTHTGSTQVSSAGSVHTSAVTGSATAGAQPMNGSCHHPAEALSSAKQNGLIHMPPSFSMKWRNGKGEMQKRGGDVEKESRERKGVSVGPNRSSSHLQHHLSTQRASPQRSPSATQREIKKPSMSYAGRGRGFGLAVTRSLLPSPQSSPKTFATSKIGQRSTKPELNPPDLTNETKQSMNGHASTRQRANGANSSLRLPLSLSRPDGRVSSHPASRSGSPLLIDQPAFRSQSSDSLRSTSPASSSVSLSKEDRLRSRSLTQVRRLPSPTLTPPYSSSSLPSSLPRSPTITRSYSLNRAAERGSKELASSATRALPRAALARSPLTKPTPGGEGVDVGATGESEGFDCAKVQSSAAPVRSEVTAPSLLPPSAFKKPLLPSFGSTSKPSALSYKLTRPSLIKQPTLLCPAPGNASENDQEVSQELTGRRNSVETPPVTPSTTDESPGSTPGAPGMEGLSVEPASHGDVSILGETLEDMSLSSTSSLERNNTSQEYMDDFDNFGNGGMGILLFSSNDDHEDLHDLSHTRSEGSKPLANGSSGATELHSFLTDGMDWADMRLGGEEGECPLTRQRRSSQPDYQGGSSLDLSPSDSCGSGGTYMWDEEGLQPLGGGTATNTSSTANTANTHNIGSYDSDLNSIDILNNLESCDLDDDDLMLDDDLPEDASLHSDGDGITHMAEWRRRQLCWGTQDVLNDNSGLQCYQLTEDPGNQRTETAHNRDLLLQGLSHARSPCLSPGTGLAFDLGVDVEELAEDCSVVMAQLENLKRLLLQEEDGDEELDDTLTTETLSPNGPDASCSSHERTLHKQVEELLKEVQHLREEVRNRDRTISQLTQQLVLCVELVPLMPTQCCCQETEMERRVDRHTQTSVREMEDLAVNHKASQTPWTQHTPQIIHSTHKAGQDRLTHSKLLASSRALAASLPAKEPSHPANSPARPSELTTAVACTAADQTPGPPEAEGQGQKDGNGEETEMGDSTVNGGHAKDKRGETKRSKGEGMSGDATESSGARNRSPQLSQPSKLRCLPLPTPRMAPNFGFVHPNVTALSLGVSAATTTNPLTTSLNPSRTRVLRPPSALRDPDSGAPPSIKFRPLAPASGSSRLPKPKSH